MTSYDSELPRGIYTLREKLVLKAVGEASKPVSLAAENGDVQVIGTAGFDIVDSNCFGVDGFPLSQQARTMNVNSSDIVRLTRMTFRLSPNPALIRRNTFRDNGGQLVVGNGENVVISGNYFVGTDPSIVSGGVQIYGQNICVGQSYFAGLATPPLQSSALPVSGKSY